MIHGGDGDDVIAGLGEDLGLTHPVLDRGPVQLPDLVAISADLRGVLGGRHSPAREERELGEAAAVEGDGGYSDSGDVDAARQLFETNYWSPLALIKALVPAMRERDEGAIVNVSSLGAFTPFQGTLSR